MDFCGFFCLNRLRRKRYHSSVHKYEIQVQGTFAFGKFAPDAVADVVGKFFPAFRLGIDRPVKAMRHQAVVFALIDKKRQPFHCSPSYCMNARAGEKFIQASAGVEKKIFLLYSIIST